MHWCMYEHKLRSILSLEEKKLKRHGDIIFYLLPDLNIVTFLKCMHVSHMNARDLVTLGWLWSKQIANWDVSHVAENCFSSQPMEHVT